MKHNIRTFVGTLLAMAIMATCFTPIAAASGTTQEPGPLVISSAAYPYDESVFFYEDLQLNDPSALITTDEHCQMELSVSRTFSSANLPGNFNQADLLSRYVIVLACFAEITAVTQNFFWRGNVDSHCESLTISYNDKEFGLIEVTLDKTYVIVNGIVITDTCKSDLQVLVFEDGAVCISFMNSFGELEMKFVCPIVHFSQPDCSTK